MTANPQPQSATRRRTITTLTPAELAEREAAAARDALTREFCCRLEAFGKPATIMQLFQGFEPRWAVAAAVDAELQGWVKVAKREPAKGADGNVVMLPVYVLTEAGVVVAAKERDRK